MKYRKKPVVIEAVQFDGTPHGALVVFDIFDIPGSKFVPNMYNMSAGEISIPTLEGVMKASAGDWIIKEPFPTKDRQYYPCKQSIFEATYEPVA
ncbi:MAG TPA: hypothetical protein PLZ24_16855 [Flavobacteriales bacterium]|nr:hypothetical protein [Flavobacteriales bacterium]